jgi:hypothetical protein
MWLGWRRIEFMTNKKTNQIATHIGYDVVVVGRPASPIVSDGKPTSFKNIPGLTLMSQDGADEGAYFPAQCIAINGEDSVRQLRDFCDAILEPKDNFLDGKIEE